jgi:excisionase family DNA binding protein
MEGKQHRRVSMSEYLTIDGVAELLGKNRKAVEKMVERRLVPYRKHGKRIIFSRSELSEFFDNLPGVTLEEAERSVEERVGRGER